MADGGGLPYPGFDWKHPDYLPVWQERARRLSLIRQGDINLSKLQGYYRDHPADFINDWGVTADPRSAEHDLPVVVPFLLFPRQREWIEWVIDHWRRSKPGITPKSRDGGLSWLAMAFSCAMCLHREDMAIGFGSRKEEYVDRIGSPKALFPKGRLFMRNLPEEFRGGWREKTDAPHMRMNFPDTNSNISGEAGDSIGRGDRAGIYFVDEAAFLERPEMTEASLSMTTNCRIDISSSNGPATPFALKRRTWKAADVFTFHWRQDPRKDDAWYAKKCEELPPVVVASEIDIDDSASISGILIPLDWVYSSVDAHERLKFKPTGARRGALDVADEGVDLNAFCGMRGILVESLEEWSGKGSDIYGTVEHAFNICDILGYTELDYDADGLGAGVRGDARVINVERAKRKARAIKVSPFRGSAGVERPKREDIPGRKNEDFFANLKAQKWWSLRMRFQNTYRAVHEHRRPFDPDTMISISSKIPLYQKALNELAQPTYAINLAGKIVVDKKPEGMPSPNLADGIMICAAGHHMPINISADAVNAMAGRVRAAKAMAKGRAPADQQAAPQRKGVSQSAVSLMSGRR